ncbi:tetratricopeptide repeat protein [Streptomyces sp. NPDC012637]|uniref:tetratricopeptide repeat protein n=1 Tax=Streptomyces sp. NPDC012637 TaxID=3364842 RepID=UPI0036E081C5
MSGHDTPRLHGAPQVDDLPGAAQLLAIALCTATRIEPELLRAIRIEVRPELNVSAESALWFGPWALRSSGHYMAIQRELLGPLRDLLCSELSQSQEDAPVRRAGQVIQRLHRDLSPALALEEEVTWAAVCADAGLEPYDADVSIDRMLERALQAALHAPARRQGLRRWFAGAWQRFPERVRQTPTALELFGVLSDEANVHGRQGIGTSRVAHLAGVDDVVVPVRHDGSSLTIGDPSWPAVGILVPDTQPRVLEIAGDARMLDEAQKVRVPRGAQMAVPVSHVPVYVRTARGVVYEVAARGASEVLPYPARIAGGTPHRGLLGSRVSELRDHDALRFGIAARIKPVARTISSDMTPDLRVQTDLVPRMPRASDLLLPLLMSKASERSQLIVVAGKRSSGRTRAAWEAVRQALSDWWVWAPPLIDRSKALLEAITEDRIGSHTVLWLDDLDICLRQADGEDVARALSQVLDDRALAPLLLVATGAPFEAGLVGLGPAARALMERASFVHAATGRRETAAVSADAVSVACETTIARAVAAEPPHKLTVRSDLPKQQSSFAGRISTLQRLFSYWSDSAQDRGRVAVLMGMPGVGKTSLAAAAVHAGRGRGWFPGGVLWLSLRGRPFTADVLLRALGVPESGISSAEDPWVMCSALMHQVTGAGREPVMLVLDDTPSVGDAPLTHLAPGLSVLITTRSHGLRSAARTVVGPLDTADAVSLLAKAVPPGADGRNRLEENPAATRMLGELCGGHPLALVQAADLLRKEPTLTPASLVERLERSAVLADALSDADHSVRAALEWAYKQLTTAQAAAFRLLGLLPGEDFSEASALALLGASPDYLLRRLFRLHLLQRLAHHDVDRWRMHGIVKRFAADQCRLQTSKEERSLALRRLMGFYEQHAREADAWTRDEHEAPRIAFSSRRQAVQWLERERRNLVAAVHACLREGLASTGAAIALALAEFLTQTRQFDDLMRIMNAVLSSPAADGANQYTRAAALNNFAVAMATTGDFDAAMSALRDAAQLGDKADERSAAYALMMSNLGATLLMGGRLQDAVRILRDAATRCTEIGERTALVQILSNLAIALLEQGKPHEALTQLSQAQALSKQDQVSLHENAVLLTTLGTAQLRTGRTEEGMETLALAALRVGQMGKAPGHADVLESLGRAMLEVGQFEEARGLFAKAVTAYGELGDVGGEARAGNNLGLALLESQQDGAALLELERARDRYLTIGDRSSAAQCLNNVGNALRRLERTDEAIYALSQAVAELRSAGDQRALAEALLNLGLSYVEVGDVEAAHSALSYSAEVHTALGDITSRARALHALGRAAHSAGDSSSLDYLRAATESFRHGRDTTGLFDSLLLLSDLLNDAGEHREARAVFQEAMRLREAVRED